MVWILIKAQSDIATGALTFAKKPLNTENCDYNFSDVLNNSTMPFDDSDR